MLTRILIRGLAVAFFCVKTPDTLQRFCPVCIYLFTNHSFFNYIKFKIYAL